MWTELLIVGALLSLVTPYDVQFRPPYFIVEPPPTLRISNTIGGRLDCAGGGFPEPFTTWYYKDGNIVTDVSALRSILRNGSLVIYPFNQRQYRSDVHDSIFYCTISNSVGTIISRDVRITTVLNPSSSLLVEIYGSSPECPSLLRCVSQENEKEDVKVTSWLKDSSLILHPNEQSNSNIYHLRTGHLYIKNLSALGAIVRFKCFGTTSLSEDILHSNVTEFFISDKKILAPPVFIHHSEIISAQLNREAILKCLVSACPEASVSWSFVTDGLEQTIFEDDKFHVTGFLLIISNVTNNDAGVYRCRAENDLGQITADIRLNIWTPVILNVTPPSVMAIKGTSTALQCIVLSEHTQKLKYMWFKDGHRILANSYDNDNLHISAVARDDVGMYQCMVQETNGNTASAFSVLSIGDYSPSIIYAFIEQTVQPGRFVSLKCSASGNPTPNIFWRLDNFEISHSSRLLIGEYSSDNNDVIGHLNYTSVQIEDGGEYTCIATNRAGTVEHSAKLNVYGPPYIRDFPHVIGIAGKTFVLKCPVGGYPLERIYWTKGDVVLPDDLKQSVSQFGVLTITNLEKSDEGKYTCHVQSKSGIALNRDTELKVIVSPKLIGFPTQSVTVNVGDRWSLTCTASMGDLPLDFRWKKNGIDLKSEDARIMMIDKYTTILTIENIQHHDSGNYSCFVQNRVMSDTQSCLLQVNVPPIIEPFKFQEDLTEGMRTRLVCGVSRADLPLSLLWLKDNISLPTQLTEISLVDSFTSLLNIPKLQHQHSGRYTCVAKNSGGEVSHSTDLLVKVPPRWEIEPQDTSVLKGYSALIDCKSFSVPPANVTWKLGLGGKLGQYVDLNRENMRVMSNGSLLVQHATIQMQSYYLCRQCNGIGPCLNKVIHIKVNSPPAFVSRPGSVVAKLGGTAIFLCTISGDPPLYVYWIFGTKILETGRDFRIIVEKDPLSNNVRSELKILSVQTTSVGVYACQGNNNFGSAKQLSELILAEPPYPPRDVRVLDVDSLSVKLDWHQFYRRGVNDLTHYAVEYCEMDGMWKKSEVIGNRLANNVYVRKLKPATFYAFRVIAVSDAGESPPSGIVTARTEQQSPSGPPTNIYIKALTSTSIFLKWSPPYKDKRHGHITNYTVVLTRVSTSYTRNFTVPTHNDNGIEYKINDLAKYSKYFVKVAASNKAGSGPLSDPQMVQTLEDVPTAAPINLHCVSITPQSIQILWSPPPEDSRNGVILGYQVTYEPAVDDDLKITIDFQPVTLKVQQTSKIINGLYKYTNYSFFVSAYTRIGNGPISPVVLCTTDEDVPEAPSDIKVVSSGLHSLVVLWIPPYELNGVIIKYNLYMRILDKKEEVDHRRLPISANQTFHEVRDIPANVEHQFWITASTKIGEGKSSKVVSVTLSGEVPPKILTFGTELIRPWNGSTTLGCPAVGYFNRRWEKHSKANILDNSPNVIISPSGDLIIKSLQPEDEGNYTCIVDNKKMNDSINYILHIQGFPLPPVPHIVSSSSTSVDIEWSHHIRKSDTPILQYYLTIQQGYEIVKRANFSRFIRTYEILNLTCGKEYKLYMSALNKVGMSNSSDIMTFKTKGKPPSPPSTETFIRANSTFAVINFHTWEDDGCPLFEAVISYKKIADDEWIEELKGALSYELEGLMPATKYVVKAEVENGAGRVSREFSFYTLTVNGDLVTKSQFEDWLTTFFKMDYKLTLLNAVCLILLLISLLLMYKCYDFCKKTPTPNNVATNISTVHRQTETNYFEHLPYSSTFDNDDVRPNYAGFCSARHPQLHERQIDVFDRIPETPADISPYATFELPERSRHSLRGAQTTGKHFSRSPERRLRPFLNHHSVMYNEPLGIGPFRDRNQMMSSSRAFYESESDDEFGISDDSRRNVTFMMQSIPSEYNTGMDGQYSSSSSELSACMRRTLPRNTRARRAVLEKRIAETRFITEPPRQVHRPAAVRLSPQHHLQHQNLNILRGPDYPDTIPSTSETVFRNQLRLQQIEQLSTPIAGQAPQQNPRSSSKSDYSIAV